LTCCAAPVARTLLGLTSLPRHLADRLTTQRDTTPAAAAPRTGGQANPRRHQFLKSGVGDDRGDYAGPAAATAARS